MQPYLHDPETGTRRSVRTDMNDELDKIVDIAIKHRLQAPSFVDDICIKCGAIYISDKKTEDFICPVCKGDLKI